LMGMIVQGLGLGIFVWVSQAELSLMGKPIVIGMTVVTMALLLWYGGKKRTKSSFSDTDPSCFFLWDI